MRTTVIGMQGKGSRGIKITEEKKEAVKTNGIQEHSIFRLYFKTLHQEYFRI